MLVTSTKVRNDGQGCLRVMRVMVWFTMRWVNNTCPGGYHSMEINQSAGTNYFTVRLESSTADDLRLLAGYI